MPRSLALADLTGSGFPDLIAGSAHSEGHLAWFENRSVFWRNYCDASPNSTGEAGSLSMSGTPSLLHGSLTAEASHLPDRPGLVFHGSSQQAIAFGNGQLCVGGPLTRGAPLSAVGGTVSYTYDESDVAHSLAAFVGTTRYFQYWFRDPAAGGAGFDLTDATSVLLRP